MGVEKYETLKTNEPFPIVPVLLLSGTLVVFLLCMCYRYRVTQKWDRHQRRKDKPDTACSTVTVTTRKIDSILLRFLDVAIFKHAYFFIHIVPEIPALMPTSKLENNNEDWTVEGM